MTHKDKGVSPLSAAIAGAAVGAAAAAMMNKDTREKVKKTLNEGVAAGKQQLDGMKVKVDNMKQKGSQEAQERINKAKADIKSSPEI